jgi:hypothetical protein
MKFDLSQSIAAHDSFPARIASAPGPAREIQLKPNAYPPSAYVAYLI